MRDRREFYDILRSIHGKAFSNYSQLVGDYDFSRYILKIGELIVSPAAENIFVITIPESVAGFPERLYQNAITRTALEDELLRNVVKEVGHIQAGGKTLIEVPHPDGQILPRSAVSIDQDGIDLHIALRLPEVKQAGQWGYSEHDGLRRYSDEDKAAGLIDSETLTHCFFTDLPRIVDAALIYCNLDRERLDRAVFDMEAADQLRQLLHTQGLVGFVADGTIMKLDNQNYPFTSHEDTRIQMDVANDLSLSGTGIPVGITVVLGNDPCERQALMRAVADGIYNHTSDDRRKFAVSSSDSVYVRAEEGRSVVDVDLSPFMPDSNNASHYTCDHCDSYSSQAAGVVEALISGARVLLFDERDAGVGFLSADERICTMLGRSSSRLPLVALARHMVDELGVSLVVGGWASVYDWMGIADHVLLVEGGCISDVTSTAKQAAAATMHQASAPWAQIVDNPRWVLPSSVDPSNGRADMFVRVDSKTSLQFGKQQIDLSKVIQLSDKSQTKAVGLILQYLKIRYLDQVRPMRELLDLMDRELSTEGLECLTREVLGDLARPRRHEIAAALNRLRSLRIARTEDL